MKETNEDIQIHKHLCCGVNVQPTIGVLHMTIIFFLVIDWWRSSGTYWINLPSLQWRCHTDCFAQILCNLLFPDEEKVKEGLKETANNSLPHLRNKAFMAEQLSPAQKQHQVRATSAHIHQERQEVLPNRILQSD